MPAPEQEDATIYLRKKMTSGHPSCWLQLWLCHATLVSGNCLLLPRHFSRPFGAENAAASKPDAATCNCAAWNIVPIVAFALLPDPSLGVASASPSSSEHVDVRIECELSCSGSWGM